ncbi:MAG: hypothetical protein PHG40_05030 [Candidatus Omnitrophica bacterium]|nr:hypothetical protein [Candidatus Omnitrophota bacterium]
MRIPKFLSTVFFITAFCLFYVYQQTRIFCLAYEGQKKQVFSQELLDKNTLLRYNIKRNTSLAEISSRLPKCAQLQIPDGYRLVKLESAPLRMRQDMAGSKRETLLSRIFGVKRQAEARPINPP